MYAVSNVTDPANFNYDYKKIIVGSHIDIDIVIVRQPCGSVLLIPRRSHVPNSYCAGTLYFILKRIQL
jgi:hypothetical protein